MKGISSIIFDFDGTLADTAAVIVASMTRTFTDMGIPVPSEDEIRRTIGMKLGIALARLGNLSESQAADATERYKRFFAENGVERIGLFPGVSTTLRVLRSRGIRMSIATSRNADSLGIILRNNGIHDCFEYLVTNSDNLAPKPDPAMVLHLLDRMGVAAGETLVVGDTTYDIEMGSRAHCRTCAVCWGNHDRGMLSSAGPEMYLERFEDILSIWQ